MKYYTLKLYVPDQVFLLPVGASFLEIIPPGVLSDRDGQDFGDAACPCLLIGVSEDDNNPVHSAELSPLRVRCTPLTPSSLLDISRGQKCFDSGRVATYTDNMDVFTESNEMVYLGKFSISRRGCTVSYIVSCESRPSLANRMPISLTSVIGDSSAGFAEGAIPRAVI